MEGVIRLVRLVALPAFIMYLGYLFYDKDPSISNILLFIGIVLAIYIIFNEIEFKRKRHEAPCYSIDIKGSEV